MEEAIPGGVGPMMYYMRLIGRCVLILLVLGGPPALVWYKSDFLTAGTFFELLRIYLATTAFVGALWAVYLKDARLRCRSEYLMVFLLLFVVILAFAAVGALLLLLDKAELKPASTYFGYLALICYVILLGYLVNTVFVQSYNEVYNLRTNKFYKYFRPFRLLRNTFAKDENYELSVEPRTYDVGRCPLMSNLFNEPASRERSASEKERFATEKDRIKKGASVLLTGTITGAVIDEIAKWLVHRLKENETASYVACARHPFDIWERLKAQGIEEKRDGHPFRDSLVLVDVFTPAFGFTDEIHEDRDRQLSRHGVSCVKAKTFAGLHTAVNQAFKIIKKKEKEQKGKQIRRPSVMVYDRSSALCDTESVEQFRVFWRHVIPSEQCYGMITLIVEDEMTGDGVINPLKGLVDFVLVYSAIERKFTRTK